MKAVVNHCLLEIMPQDSYELRSPSSQLLQRMEIDRRMPEDDINLNLVP
jgi:hypothetical protein